MVLALLPGTALAAKAGPITGSNLTWSLDDSGTLSITGTGEMPHYNGLLQPRAPWYENRDQITSLSIGKGITSIGSDAFYGCNKIQTIQYKGSVDEWNKINIDSSNWWALFNATSTMKFSGSPDTFIIQSGAINSTVFWSLDSGGMLTISGSGEMPHYNRLIGPRPPWFPRLDFITGITIKSGITSIGADSFNGCSKVAHVSFPVSMTSISDAAFSGCNQIKTIHYAGTQTQWNKVNIGKWNDSALFGPSVDMKWKAGPITRYVVTLDANKGTPTTQRLMANGDVYGELPVPTRAGYEFAGWFTTRTGGQPIFADTVAKLTKNTTIYAHWTGGPVKVTFNVNGGKALSSSNKTKEVIKGDTYGALPTPTKAGYIFSGWYTKKIGGEKVTSSTEVAASSNHTLYARWTRGRTYVTVKLNPNGGTVYQDQMLVISGNRYRELPTPTKPDYIFKGWYTAKTGGKKISATSTVSTTASSQTLYAQWKSSATAKTTTAKVTVTVPPYFELPLYSSANSAKISSTAPEKGTYQNIVCTKKATLSTGVVRYFGKVGTKNVWFTYSCEMDVN